MNCGYEGRMKRLLPLLAMLTTACSSGEASVYYVDPERGSDDAAGTSPGAAWRNAPGDARAMGRAAEARLRPGDELRFRGGASYRGSVSFRLEGQPGRPIIISGDAWSPGRAIIDGADPVRAVQPCPGQAACGGAVDWKRLHLVRFTPPPTGLTKLFDETAPLYEAQYPAPKDLFYGDEIDSFRKLPLSKAGDLTQGMLRDGDLARRAGPGAALLLWVRPNLVHRRDVRAVEGDTLRFDGEGLKPYDDRDGRYALIGTVSALAQPGQYALIAPDTAVAWLRPGTRQVFVGTGRTGFDLGGSRNVVVRGFDFVRQTGTPRQNREGVSINITRDGSGGIVVRDNRFASQAMWNGQGAITIRKADDVRIEGNLFSEIERGSGMRVANSANVAVLSNRMTRVGRTGIAYFGVTDGRIERNVLTDMKGVHGNGISLYLANRRVSVTDNSVIESTRPMTFHGDKSQQAPGDHEFVIARNLFVTDADGQGALISWGGNTRSVQIRDNVLVGPKYGLMLNGSDSGVVVAGNSISGIEFNKGEGAGWQVTGNREVGKRDERALGLGDAPGLCRAARLGRGARVGTMTCP